MSPTDRFDPRDENFEEDTLDMDPEGAGAEKEGEDLEEEETR